MMRREAAQWLSRLQSGRDPDARAKFETWYSDPAHADAFDRVQGSYQRSGLLRHSSAYLPQMSGYPSPSTEAAPVFAFAVAATLALVAIGLILRGGPLMPRTDAVMLKTNVGEIRRVALSDGSSVTLDSSTRVEIEVGKRTRTARVKYGRARFEIATTGEPFVVEAGNETVTATGGIVDIDREGLESRFDVLSGTSQLQVRGGDAPRPLMLGARDGAVVGPGSTIHSYRIAAAPDWTSGMLQFDAISLAEVAKLANRYSDQQIRFDSNLGELKVTGAFRAGDTAGLAKSLAAAFKLSVHQTQDGSWRLDPAGQFSSAADPRPKKAALNRSISTGATRSK
jgi:transmembrane sensor